MSNTAVVVSGVLRHIEHASKSWKFDADYYLVVEKNIYKAHSQVPLGQVEEGFPNLISSVPFVSKTICDSHSVVSAVECSNRSLANYGPAQMACKWKVAYEKIIQSSKYYDRVILLRPDLWLFENNGDPIEPIIPATGEIYSMADYQPDIQPNRGYETTGDVFMMMNVSTFKILANFYDYVIMYYVDLVINNRHDIHSLLAKYMRDMGITLNPWLGQNYGFIVLRGNSDHMFNSTGLIEGYNLLHLMQQQEEWWRNIYG